MYTYSMDIQLKIDTLLALIDRIPDAKEYRRNLNLSIEFLKLSEDASLPKAFRDFCLDTSQSLSGDKTGPLDNASKKQLKEIFMKLKA